MLAAPRPPVSSLLELLAGTRDPERRRELLGLLVSLGRAAVAPVLARLGHAAPGEAGLLLSLLGALRDSSAGPGLLALLRREHPLLRREALRTLIGLDAPEVRRALSAFLLDPDEEIARLVAEHLGARDDGAAAVALLPHLDCGLFAGVRAEEMKRAILALGRMRATRAVRPLAELLRRRTWVSRRTQEEVQAAAAQALWRIGGDEARGALERSAAQAPAAVAGLCHRLLSRVETS